MSFLPESDEGKSNAIFYLAVAAVLMTLFVSIAAYHVYAKSVDGPAPPEVRVKITVTTEK